MWHNNDVMLNELHQIKIRLWERSGNNFHTMARMMEDEAKAALLKYRTSMNEPSNPTVVEAYLGAEH
ncbi:MAG TPA: hypothetical protein DCQ37_00920 [Desulfobacteraceae bacterium]|nr:hypothetical protein [Desulfobacteraceae bacterium]